jgi:hypothetical protein
MPSTTYNIDRIQRSVPDESRETIRDVLNEIQLVVYSQDCFQTQRIDSNGMPPILTTVDGVYEYDCPDECRRTEAIFTLNPLTRSRARPTGPRQEYYFRNKGYFKAAISTRDATIDSVAKITFQDNPGSTGSNFYHLYYIKPTPIISEDIQLTLPEETHYLIRKAVVAMFVTEKYGQSAFDDSVMERVARKIRNSLNRGAQSNAGETQIREEFQDDYQKYYGYRV